MPLEVLLCLIILSMAWFPCCPGCDIADDAFDDVTNWTQDAGTWSIVAGQLNITNASARIRHNTVLSTSTWANYYSVEVTHATGNHYHLIFDYKDSNNYHYWEIAWVTGANASTIKLQEVSGGVTTQKGVDLLGTISTTDTLFVCRDGNTAYLKPSLGSDVGVVIDITAHNGTYVGFGTNAAHTGTVKFDDFDWDKEQAAESVCPDITEPCSHCTKGKQVLEMDAEVTGWVDNVCTDCTDMNTTYVLFKNGSGTTTTGYAVWQPSQCGFSSTTISTCDVVFLSVVFGASSIKCSFKDALGADVYSQTITPGDADCRDEADGLTFDSFSSSSTQCDYSGLVVTLTVTET